MEPLGGQRDEDRDHHPRPKDADHHRWRSGRRREIGDKLTEEEKVKFAEVSRILYEIADGER